MHRTLLFGLIILLIGASTAVAVRAAAQSEAGAAMLYMPLIGRAEPELSQIVGLTTSDIRPDLPAMPDSEIFLLSADGSSLTRLTDNDVQDYSPEWSPDGTMMVWHSNSDAWLMNADGSEARALSTFPGTDDPNWSPDGATILIRTYDGDAPVGERSALYLTTPTSPAPTPIFTATELFQAHWSPDGAYLAFAAGDANHSYNVYTVRADGTGLTALGEGDLRQWTWSPDSAWIAFWRGAGDDSEVYVARPDGSETQQLTNRAGEDIAGQWVENGARLLVTHREPDGAPGTGAVDLVAVPDGAVTPFLSQSATVHAVAPDGVRVAYSASVSGTRSLYLRATDSPTATLVGRLDCQQLCFAPQVSWSDNGAYMSYAEEEFLTTELTAGWVYVANGDGAGFRLLDATGALPQWLPYSTWLSAFAVGENGVRALHLFHPQTNRKVRMPDSPEGPRLLRPQWRYMP